MGIIDSSGNYQSGNTPGQATIQVSDAAGNSSSAVVSIVQSSYQSYSEKMANELSSSQVRLQPTAVDSAVSAWVSTNRSDLKASPIVRGQVVANDNQIIDSQGDEIHSCFFRTSLTHPLIRQDELIENSHVVAVEALVEDQFLVTLSNNQSESDLDIILAKSCAHVSRHLPDTRTYLISMDRPSQNTTCKADNGSISEALFASRSELKKQLSSIGQVSPNYILRAPASTQSQ